MKGYVLTVERTINATPEAIFAILSDVSKHSLIDGSGMLQGEVADSPEQLQLGSKFGMNMKLGIKYSTVNKVVEFKQNELIAWQTGPETAIGRYVAGRIWRYELEPVEGGTRVRESWDITPDHQRFFLKLGDIYSKKTSKNMERTLEQLDTLLAGTSDPTP